MPPPSVCEEGAHGLFRRWPWDPVQPQRQQQVRNGVKLVRPVIRGLYPKPGLHTHWGSSAAPVRMPPLCCLWTAKRGLWIVIFEGSPDGQTRLRLLTPNQIQHEPGRGSHEEETVEWTGTFLSFRWHLTHCHCPVHCCSRVYCFWYLLDHPRQPSSHQAACIPQPPRNQHFTSLLSPQVRTTIV